jgi:hypothetical protein
MSQPDFPPRCVKKFSIFIVFIDLLTNFGLAALLLIERRSTSKRQRTTMPRKESACKRLTRLYRLKSKVLTHRVWNGIAILSSLEALFCEQFYLRSPGEIRLADFQAEQVLAIE